MSDYTEQRECCKCGKTFEAREIGEGLTALVPMYCSPECFHKARGAERKQAWLDADPERKAEYDRRRAERQRDKRKLLRDADVMLEASMIFLREGRDQRNDPELSAAALLATDMYTELMIRAGAIKREDGLGLKPASERGGSHADQA